MDRYRGGYVGYREHSTILFYSLSTSLTVHPYLHLHPDPCKHALCKGHARLHASTSLHLWRGQICKRKSSPFSLGYWLPTPAHKGGEKVTEKRRTCKEMFLPCFSQSLLSLAFLLTFPHTHIYSHIHTQSTHSIFRTHGTSTQRETTWTKRSGFTLEEELEPLRVETEENYNI